MSLIKFIFSSARCLMAAALLLACVAANAQIIDRIDVVPGANDAAIIIRFSENIQYLRHAPSHDGKELRIFFRLTAHNMQESDLMQETVDAPRTDRVPDVSVLYPELVNGMLVTFSQATKFAVQPGADGRSINITVPLLPAKAPSSTAKTEEVAKDASNLVLPVPEKVLTPVVTAIAAAIATKAATVTETAGAASIPVAKVASAAIATPTAAETPTAATTPTAAATPTAATTPTVAAPIAAAPTEMVAPLATAATTEAVPQPAIAVPPVSQPNEMDSTLPTTAS